jgi:glycogen operon protein
MLLGGDEMGRTQGGNNNAYCQDNEISWFDWENVDADLLEFTARLIAFRRDHPVFRRRRWFQGKPIHGEGVRDIGWFRPDGELMGDEDWRSGFSKSLGVFLNGDAIPSLDERGDPVRDDSFYILFNAHHEPLPFRLPAREQWGRRWRKVLDTNEPIPERGEDVHEAGSEIPVAGRAVVVLIREE